MLSEKDAFIRMIRENPDDEDARLVFADWCEEHGDLDLATKLRAGKGPFLTPTIADVTKWMTMHKDRRRSHIILSGGMKDLSLTACGTLTYPATITDKPGFRLCRKCVENLPLLRFRKPSQT